MDFDGLIFVSNENAESVNMRFFSPHLMLSALLALRVLAKSDVLPLAVIRSCVKDCTRVGPNRTT